MENLQKQNNLFDQNDFDGAHYVAKFDHERLSGKAKKIFELMSDGVPKTLSEINEGTGCPEASISATLRDFRKEKFGWHTVKTTRRGEPSNGLFQYELIINHTGERPEDAPMTKKEKMDKASDMIITLGKKIPDIYKQELRDIYNWVMDI